MLCCLSSASSGGVKRLLVYENAVDAFEEFTHTGDHSSFLVLAPLD